MPCTKFKFVPFEEWTFSFFGIITTYGGSHATSTEKEFVQGRVNG
ncbi:hypothetical protein PAECIP111890_00194 [Paenibacillus sp. JJ-223]|nr:hypothetical protein PAECIP111890_00194 [Paenibacillus sp. JJ-223]